VEARRGTSTQRGYGADWQRISAEVIAEEGQCRDCGTTGTPENPLTCDHVVPKSLGGTDDRSNLACRCRRHNSAKGGRLP
jgi:5-methylcytosine-specific restriction endonuclease McrA